MARSKGTWQKGHKTWNKGKTGLQSHNTASRLKISIAHKGKPAHNKGIPMKREQKEKLRITLLGKRMLPPSQKGRKYTPEQTAKWGDRLALRDKRILEEALKLQQQGYRVIPITKVIPDIVAFKDGKVVGIEVEYQKPNYTKYTDDIKKWFDDIIWILR